MKDSKRRKWRSVCLLAVLCVGIIWGTEQNVQVSAEPAKERVEFRDDSGRYLEKIQDRWYLRGAQGETLTGLQKLNIPRTDTLHSGYYYFDKTGKTEQKRAVYHFQNVEVEGREFDGYYYHNTEGRFPDEATGVRRLYDLKAGSKEFDKFYYIGAHGKIGGKAQMRYIPRTTTGGETLSGYYYFHSSGRLCRSRDIHKVTDTVLNGVRFHGYYYFGERNGGLHREYGAHRLDGEWYCFSSWGKMYTNTWKGGYYYKDDGTRAISEKLPDGSYVGYDGKKCKKEEVKLGKLKAQLQDQIKGYPGTWSVYVENLKTGDMLSINDTSLYSASVIKPFVMASTYQQIKDKKLKETSYINSLLNAMITVSDNEAYNELVKRQNGGRDFISGAKTVNSYLKKNGYSKTSVGHTLHPSSSASIGNGMRNMTSARDCGVLLERIYKGTCVNKSSSAKMLNLLLRQQRRWKIPASLPAGTKVANKTGETSTSEHDMAIVYSPKTTYVISIMSSNGGSMAVSRLKNISYKVYDYFN